MKLYYEGKLIANVISNRTMSIEDLLEYADLNINAKDNQGNALYNYDYLSTENDDGYIIARARVNDNNCKPYFYLVVRPFADDDGNKMYGLFINDEEEPQYTSDNVGELFHAAHSMYGQWKTGNWLAEYGKRDEISEYRHIKSDFEEMIRDYIADRAPELDDLEITEYVYDDEWTAYAKDSKCTYQLNYNEYGNVLFNYVGAI